VHEGDDLISISQFLITFFYLLQVQTGFDVNTIVVAGILVLIGIIIIMVVGAMLFFLPAVVIAGVVWFLTGSDLYTGLAFLAIAILSLSRRK
jgi:hypothetical protein